MIIPSHISESHDTIFISPVLSVSKKDPHSAYTIIIFSSKFKNTINLFDSTN